MRKWGGYLLVLAIVLVIVAGGTLVQGYLDRTSGQLVARLQEVDRALKAENWEESRRAYSRFEQQWQASRRNWALVVDHLELDNVDMRLARLEELIHAREDDEARGECSEALMLLRHIPDRERLTWRNLL